MAADGSELTLRPLKNGLSREIRFSDGTTGKTVFKLFNGKFGTVSDDQKVSGIFALEGNSLSVVYADGGSEVLTVGADHKVSIDAKSAAGKAACVFWFPEGHDFTAQERKSARTHVCSKQAPIDVAAAPVSANPKSWKAFHKFYASFVASHEGGYTVNDGNGSPANYGINQGANPDVDVLSLKQKRAEQLLYERYWLASGADQLPAALAKVHGDTAINMGVKTANELLEQSGGDPRTYLALRDERYRDIADSNPDKASYLSLWLARTDDLRNLLGIADTRRYSYAQYQRRGYY